MKTEIEIRTSAQLGESFNTLREHFEASGGIVVIIGKLAKRRSLPQNASLHLYCEQMAAKMNDAGYTQRKLVGNFKDGFELPVECHMIKAIFREVGKAMFQKESTADLTTVEIQEVYRIVDGRFGETTGCRVEWPSKPEPPIPEDFR